MKVKLATSFFAKPINSCKTKHVQLTHNRYHIKAIKKEENQQTKHKK